MVRSVNNAAIEFTIDALPAVTDAQAAATGSTHLFEQHQTNLAMTILGVMGETDPEVSPAAETQVA